MRIKTPTHSRCSMTFAALALAMLATSCSSDLGLDGSNPASNGDKVAMTFNASQETCATSRTALSSDGTKINWQETDKVTIWDGYYKNEFSVAPNTDATLATLTGSVTIGTSSFTAVYPNSVAQSCTFTSDAINGLVIPATQTATSGTFDPQAALMTSVATEGALPFKNVCSFLKLTTDKAFVKIVLTAKTDAAIAGTFSVADYGTKPVLTATSGSTTNVITLQTDGTNTFAEGTYYITLAPGEYSDMKLDCYTDANNFVEKTFSTTFTRSAVYDFGSTDQCTSPTLLPGSFSVSPTKVVRFTKGNLYWDGTAYHLEANQYESPNYKYGDKTYSENHVSYFFYSANEEVSRAKSYSDPNRTKSDLLWCNSNNKITVNGTSGLYVLTDAEWKYLIGEISTSPFYGKYNMRKWNVTVADRPCCLVIAPDNFTGTIAASYTAAEWATAESTYGLVCFPAAGIWSSGQIGSAGVHGYYWSSTPYETDITYSYYQDFESDSFASRGGNRYEGKSIRLVWDDMTTTPTLTNKTTPFNFGAD